MCQNMAENIKTSVEELRKLISIENVVENLLMQETNF